MKLFNYFTAQLIFEFIARKLPTKKTKKRRNTISKADTITTTTTTTTTTTISVTIATATTENLLEISRQVCI